MGGSCHFHRLILFYPRGVRHHRQTHCQVWTLLLPVPRYWQVWTLLSQVPRLGKLHRLATREERGTQDQGPRVVQDYQQGTVRPTDYLNTSISEPFRPEEFAAALRRLKPGKSPGLDSIFPKFILHAGSALKSWFREFLSSCMRQLKIPKIWRREQVAVSSTNSCDRRALVVLIVAIEEH